MRGLLLLSLVCLALCQLPAAWQANFVQTTPATGTGRNTGTMYFNWGTSSGQWQIKFTSQTWTETYFYNSTKGYYSSVTNPALNTRTSAGSGCGTCGITQLDTAMPPLSTASTVAPYWIAGPASTVCPGGQRYNPSQGSQFLSYFIANSTMVCSAQLTDGRLFTFTSFTSGSGTITQPTGCKCNSQMDVWILVDHSSSINDAKMAQFKSFVTQFLGLLNISPGGVNVGMSWFHWAAGLNFQITGNTANINAGMNQWWTNCSATFPIVPGSWCLDAPTNPTCLQCQQSATATSSAIHGYSGPTTSGNWIRYGGQANVESVAEYFYNPAKGGSTRNVPKMFVTLTDGAVNHLRNQNGGVGGCSFASCSPDLTAAMQYLRAQHNARFPGQSLTTVSMGIGLPGSDPNLSLSPEHLLVLAEGKPENTFMVGDFSGLSAAVNDLLLRSCPIGTDVVQEQCQNVCCGLCVCGTCKAPNSCVNSNKCTEQVLGSCCSTVAKPPAVSCPTPNACNVSTCDPNTAGVTSMGRCSYTARDCSSLNNGCIKYLCTTSNGQCTTQDTSTCPPVDCVWGGWSTWTSCSVTCGNGTQTQTRTITTQAQNNGAPCTGPTSQSRTCTQPCCAVACKVSSWGSWGPACPTPCGTGTQTRTRTQTAPAVCGGAQGDCATLSQSRSCQECVPRNCVGSNSTGGCICINQGTSGYRVVTYTITTTAQYGGTPCPHATGTTWNTTCTTAQLNSCPRPCNEAWSSWSACDCQRHTQFRNYSIFSGPANGGTACTYSSNRSQEQACTPTTSQGCPLYGPICVTNATCDDNYACSQNLCLLKPDGKYHCDWTQPTDCGPNLCYTSNACDPAVGCIPVLRSITSACPNSDKCKIATCDPTLNSGAGGCVLTPVNCAGVTNGCETFSCKASTGKCTVSNRTACPPVNCDWTQWGPWSACSATCGGGVSISTRTKNVTERDGGVCTGTASQSVTCNTQCCAQNCVMNSWSSWSSCTVCSGLNRTRSRTMRTNSSCGGTPCPTDFSQIEECPCLPRDCVGVNQTSTTCVCAPDGLSGWRNITFTVTQSQVGTGADCTWEDGHIFTEACPTNLVDAQCARPCIDELKNWTECNCYTGMQKQEYFIYQRPANGGTACQFPANFTTTQNCTPTVPCTELGPPCTSAEQCNDELACTEDLCILITPPGELHCNWTATVTCPENNICNYRYCDQTIGCRDTPKPLNISCPIPNLCTVAACDPTLNSGAGGCVFTPVNCSGFQDGCQKYDCDMATGSCTVPNRSECPPIPCTYGEWTAWTDCGITCGNGTQFRTRSINQTAQDGGAECDGPADANQTCDAGCCPVDCELSQWGPWDSSDTQCPMCGLGNQTRSRTILTETSCGGAACLELIDTSLPCIRTPDVDCVGRNVTGPCNCTSEGTAGTHILTFEIVNETVCAGSVCSWVDGFTWEEECSAAEVALCPRPCKERWSNFSVCDCFNKSQWQEYYIDADPENGGVECTFPTPRVLSQECEPDPSLNCPPPCVSPADCDDGNHCTEDLCIQYGDFPVTNCNWETPVTCNDSSVCTRDTCDPLVGCVYDTILFCDDSNNCTIDTCDPELGCVYEDVICEDIDACNLGVCHPILGCGIEQLLCGNPDNSTDNCTLWLCDANYTQNDRDEPCYSIDTCGSLLPLAGLAAGLIALFIVLGILALALCGGGAYAASTAVAAMNENAVIHNPLYVPDGGQGTNPLFSNV